LPRLIGTSDVLCRGAKPRSAILTRLERSPSSSAHTKLDAAYENVSNEIITYAISIIRQHKLRMLAVLSSLSHFGETNPLTDPIAAPSVMAAISARMT
jgi:hypothetical protein